jgi:hypothetical protein
MKKIIVSLFSGVLLLNTACKKSDNTSDPGGGNGGGGSSTVDIRGTIVSDQHWTGDKTYRLRGYVYVTSGATVTIDPGTKIVSNKDSAGVLVIYKGAKIMAQGTASQPIVFTSAETNPQPGDFGGVVLVGLAKGNGNHAVLEGGVDAAYNTFGGNNDADNSGVLKYVRIEYGGKAVNPGDEINGLSLYAVGSGTTIDYVQVVRGLHDAYEFFGGAVNCKHLIAYNCADDDYDMDDGFHGMIQYAISIKDPKFTDNKGTTGDVSNNFEVDNVNTTNGLPLATTPVTFPVLSNFTAIGPNNGTGVSADYGWNMRWRRGSKFILANSIVLGGQKGGLRVQEDSSIAYYLRGTSAFYNSFLNSYGPTVDCQLGLTIPGIALYDNTSIGALTTGTYKTTFLAAATDAKLTDPFNNTNPNLKPMTGSPVLTGALFDFGGLTNAFFDHVTFRGALDPNNDWTTGWTVWNK